MPSDLWALGVLLYELLHLRRPFDGMSLPSLFEVRAALPSPGGVSCDNALYSNNVMQAPEAVPLHLAA